MTRDAMLIPPPDTPVFISTLRMLVEERLGASVPVGDLVRQIQGWVKANDIRRDELEWSGLQDWLKPIQELLPDCRIRKSEILEFLDAFELPISDVWYGTDWSMLAPRSNAEARISSAREELARRLEHQGVDDAVVLDSMIGTMLEAAAEGGESPFPDLDESTWNLARQLSEQQRYLEAITKDKRSGFEKFADHVLPGGEYYRELLLTLPASNRTSGMAIEVMKARAEIDTLRNWISDPTNASDPVLGDQEKMLIAKVRQLAVLEAENNRRPAANFKNRKHWDEPNVIGHVRFTERIIPFNAIAKLPVYNLPAYVGASAEYQAGTAVDALPGWATVPAEVAEELKDFAASDVLVVFPSEVLAQADGSDERAALVELPLHARVLSVGRVADGTTAYLVFRGGVPEKRVLFVEEIQSDWAQEGRRVGFRQELTPVEQEEMQVLESLGSDLGSRFNRYQTLAAKLAGPVPYGPFVTETKDWVSLCMKRVIRHAAERGYDAIAWTTGEQQMDRFYATGGESIRRLRCKRLDSERFEIDMDVAKLSGDVIRHRHFEDTIQGLEKRFGVVLAQAIVDRTDAAKTQPSGAGGAALSKGGAMLRMSAVGRMLPESRPVRDFDGYVDIPMAAGIKIGNLGLAAFYDKVLPSIVKDLVRKLGGQGLESISIPLNDGKTAQQIGFSMTDTMRDRALAGMPRYHRAWHGSAKQFDNFSLDHVGTGEGAQAYGWGLYFASNRDVAEWYRNRYRSAVMIMPDGRRLTARDNVHSIYPDAEESWLAVVDDVLRNGASEYALKHGVRMQYEAMRFGATGARLKRARALHKAWKTLCGAGVRFEEEDKGQLYEVELAPSEDLYLDWEASFSNQSHRVKQVLETFVRAQSGIVREDTPDDEGFRFLASNGEHSAWGRTETEALARLPDLNGEQIYNALSRRRGAKAASEQLRAMGIAGIKYLDGISRGAGEGDRNYVVFDDTAISVTAKYSRARVGEEAAFADVTPKRLAKEIGFYGYPGSRSRGFITRMPVADFLELTTPDENVATGIKQAAGAFDPVKFDSMDSFLPYLDVDPGTGQVTGHEGRHRAAALLASGAVDMPVVLSLRAPATDLHVRLLKGQCGRGTAIVGKTIPLAEGNENLVMAFINAKPEMDIARPGPLFYSALFESIAGLSQASGSVEQWKGIVSNLSGKGIKRDEIEWTGILDWLDLQEGRVLKTSILTYLQDNGVRVEEQLLGTDRTVKKLATGWAVVDPGGEVYSIYGGQDEARAVAEHGTQPTQYSQYVLPGGKQYRELLLTLPDSDVRREAALRELDEAERRYEASRSIEDYSALVKARDMLNAVGGLKQRFRSRHFQGRLNILAHVRFNQRVDPEGRRVLFVEEIQSDWAQLGKRQGFKDAEVESKLASLEEQIAELRERERSLNDQFNAATGDIEHHKRAAGREAEIHFHTERRASIRDQIGVLVVERQGLEAEHKRLSSAVIPAPFVTDTKAWVGLVLKRMIRFAAENGFESVAWTTGEQQADRYDLSKQIESLRLVNMAAKYPRAHKDDKPYKLIAYRDGRVVIEQNVDEFEIEDYVGKEVAKRLLESDPVDEFERGLSGIDLTVGGEGMRTFYDRIVPQVANDLLRKLGGSRVATAQIPIEEEYGAWVGSEGGRMVHSFDTGAAARQWQENGYGRSIQAAQGFIEQPAFAITAAMRDKALSGLPLFMRGGSADEFPGMTVGRLREEIDNIFGYRFAQNLIDSGAFRLLQREHELPIHLQHPQGGIGGVYDDLTGKTYLVAQWIRPDMVKGMLLHEVGVHYGLNKMLGDRAQVLFDQARELVRQGNPAAVAAARKVPPDTNPAIVNEEILAYLVGDLASQKFGVVQKAVSKIKGFLFEMGADIDLTPADMAVMAEGCVRRCATASGRSIVSFFSDVARAVKRAVTFETNPLPERIREGVKYAFAGQGAGNADRSLLADAFNLSARLTESEVRRFQDLEDRYDTLSETESVEYEALSLRVDVQFDPDIVRQKTGWFSGYDGKWRFEIDDSDARLLKTAHGAESLERWRLDEVLCHPALFEAYPQLAEMKVFFDPALSFLSSTRAYFDTDKFEIGLSTWVSDEHLLSCLMHEIQHAIQGIEGFARGGSLADFSLKSNAMELFEAAQAVVAETRRVRPDIVAAWEAARDYLLSMAEKHEVPQYDRECRPVHRAPQELRARMSAAERTEYSRLVACYGELLDGTDEAKRFADALVMQHYALTDQDGLGGVRHVTARWQYERLAGEIEARDVQARLNLPMDSIAEPGSLSPGVVVDETVGGRSGHQDVPHSTERWMHSEASDAAGAGMRAGETRRTVPPYRSQGIPAEEVIVRFGRAHALESVEIALADHLRVLESQYLLALQRDHGWEAGEPLKALIEAYENSDICLSRRAAAGAVMLTPSAKREGGWQVTWMTASGCPISDSLRSTRREALEIFWESAIPQSELEFSLEGELRFVAAIDDTELENEIGRQEECVL